MQWSIWDADGNLVAECDGDNEGRNEALTILFAVNQAGPRVCIGCGSSHPIKFDLHEDSWGYVCGQCDNSKPRLQLVK